MSEVLKAKSDLRLLPFFALLEQHAAGSATLWFNYECK